MPFKIARMNTTWVGGVRNRVLTPPCSLFTWRLVGLTSGCCPVSTYYYLLFTLIYAYVGHCCFPTMLFFFSLLTSPNFSHFVFFFHPLVLSIVIQEENYVLMIHLENYILWPSTIWIFTLLDREKSRFIGCVHKRLKMSLRHQRHELTLL